MPYNKNVLLSLIVGYGLFATPTLAEDFIKSVPEESTSSLISLIKEKETQISKGELEKWQGKLSFDDEELVEALVNAKLYDIINAEIFVRSLEEKEVFDLSEIIKNADITRARQAIAATVD